MILMPSLSRFRKLGGVVCMISGINININTFMNDFSSNLLHSLPAIMSVYPMPFNFKI